PSDSAAGALMENYFNAWEDLSNDPESKSARTNLREVALAFTDFVREVDFKLAREVTALNQLILDKSNALNSLAQQVAEVNRQVILIEGSGGSISIKANDLKDRRDQLVEQMSELVNVNVLQGRNGGLSVLIQGHPIVTDQFAHPIGLRITGDDPFRPTIEFSASRIRLEINSGELGGLVRMRDEEVPAIREQFSRLITAFTNRVNELHIEGYGLDGLKGRPFFEDNETRRVM
ncbi:hypothetical protein IIA79_04540, partial [bacterium]|nr:hypothetical protein [bacterium]